MASKVYKKPKDGPCPLVFKWGTVCNSVWSIGVSKTLVDVRPSLGIEAVVSHDAPDEVVLDLGSHSLFCVFGRAPGTTGRIDEKLTISSDIKGSVPSEVRVTLEPQHRNYLHNLNMPQLPVYAPSDKEYTRQNLEFTYSWNGKELGSINVEVDVRIKKEKEPEHGPTDSK